MEAKANNVDFTAATYLKIKALVNTAEKRTVRQSFSHSSAEENSQADGFCLPQQSLQIECPLSNSSHRRLLGPSVEPSMTRVGSSS